MRTLHADLQAAVVSPSIAWLYLVKLVFDEDDLGTVAWSSAYNAINYDGVDYYAAAHLSTISPVSESFGFKSSGLSVGISGVDPTVVSQMLTCKYLNRKGYVYICATDTGEFDANKTRLLFSGSMDKISGVVGNEPSFTVSIRSRLSDWERERSVKYTDSDQKRLYPGDEGMKFIPQLSQKKIIWPRAAFLPDARD